MKIERLRLRKSVMEGEGRRQMVKLVKVVEKKKARANQRRGGKRRQGRELWSIKMQLIKLKEKERTANQKEREEGKLVPLLFSKSESLTAKLDWVEGRVEKSPAGLGQSKRGKGVFTWRPKLFGRDVESTLWSIINTIY